MSRKIQCPICECFVYDDSEFYDFEKNMCINCLIEADTRAKDSELLHPDAECAKLFKQHTLPSNPAQDMYARQLKLQEFIANKRGTLAPPAIDGISRDHICEAIYHNACLAVEFTELHGALKDYLTIRAAHEAGKEIHDVATGKTVEAITKLRDLKKELGFELADCMHFMFNILIYLGVKELPTCLFESYAARVPYYTKDCFKTYDVLGIMQLNFGRVLQDLPYKKWKTYSKNAKCLDVTGNNSSLAILIENMLESACDIALFSDIPINDLYSFYICKNNENYERQLDSKKGYI